MTGTFGTAPDGSPVHRVVLARAGTQAAVMTWGASLQDFRLGALSRPLVLGSPEFAPYLGPMRYFGAIVGRVANRIAGGRAPLLGRILDLERNEGGRNTLHGGSTGCSDLNWTLDGRDDHACRLTLTMPDGEGGFPGALHLAVTYALDHAGALVIGMEGRSDAPTFCNLAHHSYWNLDGGADIDGHRLAVGASAYLPVDAASIPLGAPHPMADTRFDFRAPRPVRLSGDAPLDHNFCLEGDGPACVVSTGAATLTMTTTEPGLQVYDGAGLQTGDASTLHDAPYGPRAGLALEPQGWPDAPNHSGFPDITLMPGDTYRQTTRFHVQKGVP